MARVETYQAYIQQLLTQRAEQSRQSSNQSPSQVEAQKFSTYSESLSACVRRLEAQWPARLRMPAALDIKDGKIWIQYDGTEGGIAHHLVELGVPKQDIVLGFQPEEARPYTEFAVT